MEGIMTLEELSQEAADFTIASSCNQAEDLGIPLIFDPPLVAAADASDPLFRKLQEPQIIGEHHQLPAERLEHAASVISYFLPFCESIRRSNRMSGLPSTEWLYGRIEGEAFNHALAAHLMAVCNDAGASADAPLLDPDIRISTFTCTWSERHVAYTAGLGVFGTSRSLITSRGCAGRYGSIITSLRIPAAPREFDPFLPFCSTCGRCISRCPAGAITWEGKDLAVCAEYQENIKRKFAPRFGCGKCQTSVPCEHKLPVSLQQ